MKTDRVRGVSSADKIRVVVEERQREIFALKLVNLLRHEINSAAELCD